MIGRLSDGVWGSKLNPPVVWCMRVNVYSGRSELTCTVSSLEPGCQRASKNTLHHLCEIQPYKADDN